MDVRATVGVPRRDLDKGKIPSNVLVLGMVSLLTDAASEMIYPLVPIFVGALGSGAVILGVIEGVAETTAAMLKLFSGIISDKIQKRKCLVVMGYTISSLIRPFTGIVSGAWQIIFIRMLDRVGKGIRSAPRDALIASSVNESIRGKAFGFHRAMDHTGAVVGPLLALFVVMTLIFGFGLRDTLLTLRWTFFLAIVPGIFAVVTLIFFLREKVDHPPAGKPFRFSFKGFDKNFLAYLSIVAFFTLGNSSDAFLLFRVEEAVQQSGALYSMISNMPLLGHIVRGFENIPSQRKMVDILFLPLVWAFFHIIKVTFSTHLGALSDRIGRKLVINIGWGIYTFVYSSFALLDRIPEGWQIIATFILFAVYALFYAFTEGAEKAFVADMVKSEMRGSAFGLYNFAVGLGALPASVIFGLVYKAFGATVAFGTGAVIAGVSMLSLALIVREKPKGASLQSTL